jgi:hypothetical protein
MSTVIHNYTRVKQMTNTANQNATCTLQLSRKKQKPPENKFSTAISEAVEESFSSFSNLDKEAAYLHLENAFKIKKQEIPCKIEDFSDAIEQMFGVGAKLVEIRIIEALHNRIRAFVFLPNKGDVDFKEYVVSLRAFLLQTL